MVNRRKRLSAAAAWRRPSRLALGFLVLATLVTVVPATPAQSPEPSGSELREAYPLHEGTPPEADRGAAPTPAGAERRSPPPATQSAGDSTFPIVIAFALGLLAFAAGFFLPLARRRSRPAGTEAIGSKPSSPRRFEPGSRSGERSKPTAPRT